MTVPGIGPQPAKIMIVGEAPGRDEEASGLPFVGASGRLLNQMLDRVGISRTDCYVTNVIQERPDNNDISKFLVKKASLPGNYLYPPVTKGNYLAPEWLSSIGRLSKEVRETNPNLIIAFGNLACWALISRTGIKDLRGFVEPCTLVVRKKVLPIYHPAYVLRAPKDKIVFQLDLRKAAKEAEFPDIRYPKRRIIVDPSLVDIQEWILVNERAKFIAVDIENKGEVLTCISFAASCDLALVVPFEDTRQRDGNYWRTYDQELCAWKLVEKILCLPAQKVFQNGCYDMQHIFRHGLKFLNCTADPMLLHHALYPELLKGLGFLGSVYTDQFNWKRMHTRGKDEKEKANE